MSGRESLWSIGLENPQLNRTLQISWFGGFSSFGCSDGLCGLWGISIGQDTKYKFANLIGPRTF